MTKLLHSITLPNGDSFTVGRPYTQRFARIGTNAERSVPKTRVDVPQYARDAAGNVDPRLVLNLPSDLIDVVIIAIFHWMQVGTVGEDGFEAEKYEVFGVPYTSYLSERDNPLPGGGSERVLQQRLMPVWWEPIQSATGGAAFVEKEMPLGDGTKRKVLQFAKKPGSGTGYFEKNTIGVRCELPVRGRGDERSEYILSIEEMYEMIAFYNTEEEEEEEEAPATGATPVPTPPTPAATAPDAAQVAASKIGQNISPAAPPMSLAFAAAHEAD